jgi:hypothetical protein
MAGFGWPYLCKKMQAPWCSLGNKEWKRWFQAWNEAHAKRIPRDGIPLLHQASVPDRIRDQMGQQQ